MPVTQRDVEPALEDQEELVGVVVYVPDVLALVRSFTRRFKKHTATTPARYARSRARQ